VSRPIHSWLRAESPKTQVTHLHVYDSDARILSSSCSVRFGKKLLAITVFNVPAAAGKADDAFAVHRVADHREQFLTHLLAGTM
jgi:hypothetical protein